jgi:pSer/pThr/pTyr-binding forkhead associated (FHA) protein
MIQLKISSGQMAGVVHDVRHFPFHIGRSARSDLRLEQPGVWDDHLTLDFDPAQGFVLTAHGEAIATVNGWPIQSVLLRNGDTIELGALKLGFWLGETAQSRLRGQEALIWIALAAVTIAEVGLLLWLLK